MSMRKFFNAGKWEIGSGKQVFVEPRVAIPKTENWNETNIKLQVTVVIKELE